MYFSQFANAGAQDGTLGVVDRSGVVRTLNVPSAAYRNPRVSPDGRQIVVETLASTGQSSLWVYDTKGGSAIRRLTQDGDTTRPVWSADGKRIAYAANTQKPQGIFWQFADGSGLPERLTTTSDEAHQDYPESFSRDGKVLSFARVRPPLGQDAWSLWTMRLDATERTPALFFDLPTSNEFGSQFSPDGKWMAYASNASPQGGEPTAFAIYMQPYPPTGAKYQISQTGGAWPIWSPDGRELIYRLNGGGVSGQRLHTVTVSTLPVPTFGAEQTLPIQGFLPVVNNREYDMFPDGKQFVMVFPVNRQDSGAVPAAQINAVLNWTEELKTRVPVKAR